MSETAEHQVDIPISERAIFRVQLTDISSTWALVKGYFAPIFADCVTHTPEDVRLLLLDQRAQLWVQWNVVTGIIEAAFVTEMVVYPRGVWVRVWLGGVRPGEKADTRGVRGAIVLFAKQNGALGLEVTGRHGWLRRFPDAKVEGLMMRVTFDG